MTITAANPRALAAAAVALGFLASAPTHARSITDTWPVLGSDRDRDCTLEIAGNGKFMVINFTGLVPGSSAHLGIANATMKPIDWKVRANSGGSWQLIFLPLLYSNADGTVRDRAQTGTVAVNFEAPRCRVAASADWAREIRVIP